MTVNPADVAVTHPFAKVETQADFPKLERSILQFWDDANIFEKLRQKNAGQAEMVVPRWADHREQPDGRSSCMGANL